MTFNLDPRFLPLTSESCLAFRHVPGTESGDSWSEEAQWHMKVKWGFGDWKQAILGAVDLIGSRMTVMSMMIIET